MRKYLGLLSLLVICLFMLSTSTVFADYTNTLYIEVYNNSTSTYTNITVLVTLNNTELANLGLIGSDGLDTNVEESGNSTYMVSNLQLGIFVPSISPHQNRIFSYRLGYTEAQTGFPMMVGGGGNITVANATTLPALGNNFYIELDGQIDTSLVGSNMAWKQDVIRIYVSAEDTIKAAILGANSTEVLTVETAADVGSGYHTVKVQASSGSNYFRIYIDGSQEGTVALGASTTQVSAYDWYFAEGGVMPYIDYIKIYKTTTKLLLEPDEMVDPDNVVDQSSSGNPGIISFGTNPSGIEVTVGALVPYYSYVPPGGSESETEGPETFIPTGLTPTTEPEESELEGMPLYDSFANTAASLGWSTQVLYGVAQFITAMVLGFAVMVGTSSMLAGGIMFCATLGLASATPVMPWWIPAIVILMIIFGVYLQRQHG